MTSKSLSYRAQVRLSVEMVDEIKKVLRKDEDRSDFFREAIEAHLKQRQLALTIQTMQTVESFAPDSVAALNQVVSRALRAFELQLKRDLSKNVKRGE